MHRIVLVFIIGQGSMESARKYQLLLQVVATFIVSFSWSCAGINQTYYVGGINQTDNAGGKLNATYNWFDPTTVGGLGSTFYQDWADSITYDDTDTLLFTYNKSLHNVLFVPGQAELDSCNKSTVTYMDRSGSTYIVASYRVTGGFSWYVFSSWVSSDCRRGMKFSTVVHGTLDSSPAEGPVESPSSTPPPSQSPSPGASPVFLPPAPVPGTPSPKSSVNLLAIVIASAICGLVLLCAVMGFIICLRRRKSEDSGASVRGPGSSVGDWARRQEALKGILEGQKGSNTCKIYTYKELDEATNHFASDNKLGSGAFGTVYKGTMSRGTVVAIKRTNNGGTDLEHFLNEVSILSQVNNRHLVKLLGCCVELDVPLLVYEFISNGTVQDHLVNAREGYPTKLDWAMRFRIAIQTAEALKYLHVQAEPPIFHRDVKSTNILLDDNFNAKVADFGLSKLVDMDATHVSTVVKGTPGYLDPEYYHNLQLTDKTDVYSYGIVLLELITSRKPVDRSLEPGLQHLGTASIPLIRSGRTRELIDKTLISKSLTGDDYVIIEGCAEIAAACLLSDRASRPSMSEVVDMLRGLKSTTPTARNFLAKSSSTESRVRGIEMQNSQGTSSSGSQVE